MLPLPCCLRLSPSFVCFLHVPVVLCCPHAVSWPSVLVLLLFSVPLKWSSSGWSYGGGVQRPIQWGAGHQHCHSNSTHWAPWYQCLIWMVGGELLLPCRRAAGKLQTNAQENARIQQWGGGEPTMFSAPRCWWPNMEGLEDNSHWYVEKWGKLWNNTQGKVRINGKHDNKVGRGRAHNIQYVHLPALVECYVHRLCNKVGTCLVVLGAYAC